MICPDCGGSDIQGTCVCSYNYPPEPNLVQKQRQKEERQRKGFESGFCDECARAYLACVCDDIPVELSNDHKQICHFCGVDLFLKRADLNIRMCVPCGIGLAYENCCRCIICNKMWLVGKEKSVCEFCTSL